MVDNLKIAEQKVWKILETVVDPEVPVLSIIDLGIVRKIELKVSSKGGNLEGVVFITPTYTGCPAMDVINMSIRMALLENGFNNIEIKTVLSPAWTTDWMSEKGRQKLKDYGIAPPAESNNVKTIQCPQCNSSNIDLISYFGSTACKALYKCNDCKEPFDYFKCH